jgi:hypothetical protein
MYGHGMTEFVELLEKLDVAYIDQPYDAFINLKTIEIDFEYFEQYKNQLVVINFSSENHINFENHVCDQLSKADINFILLTYNPAHHQQHPRMVYFPYFAFYLLNRLNRRKEIRPRKTVSKTYSLGCLSGQPRPHRIVNILKLRKKPYWNETLLNSFSKANVPRSDDLKLTTDELDQWNEIKESLPGGDPTDSVLNFPQLIDSYLHLVVETTASRHSIFTTEKTWCPVAAGVPFVILGNPGTMNFLKQQGVDIYDDVIDHKYYDTEKGTRTRIDKLHTVVDDLMSQGIDKIYNQLSDRAIANQTRFFNAEFIQAHLQTLINTIKQYK